MKLFRGIAFLFLFLGLFGASIFSLYHSSFKAYAATSPQPMGPLGSWQLDFSDEFNGTGINTSVWRTCLPYGNCLGLNGDSAFYKPQNLIVSDGLLKITAKKENTQAYGTTYKYSSGTIQTGPVDVNQGMNPTYQMLYGVAEIRARIPKGKGFWPAFWITSHPWPPEIDIMELYGKDPNTPIMGYHYSDAQGNHQKNQTWNPLPIDFSSDFHTFTLDWQPTYVRIYIDGIVRYESTDASTIPNKPMFIVAGMGVGGEDPGDPDQSTVFPSSYDIDYIRVWKKAAQAPNEGLLGTYYDGLNFTNQLFQKVDPMIDFSWGPGRPQGLTDNELFSVAWTGTITAPYSGVYTFYTQSDDGTRLTINNQLVIDKWNEEAPSERSGVITLEAGQSYPILLQYYEAYGDATMKLLWSHQQISKQLVSSTYFRTVSATTQPTPTVIPSMTPSPTPTRSSSPSPTPTRSPSPIPTATATIRPTATPTAVPTATPTPTGTGLYPKQLPVSNSKIRLVEVKASSGNTVFIRADVDPSIAVYQVDWYVNGKWAAEDTSFPYYFGGDASGNPKGFTLPKTRPVKIRAVAYYNYSWNFIETSTNY